MAKEQLVGVAFLNASGLPKEYLYRDTLGCAVGDIVVVEARDSVALARIISIYVATVTEGARPIRHVVSKVESAYTRKKKEEEAKRARLGEVEEKMRELCANLGWYKTFEVLAKVSLEVAELFEEYKKLRKEVGDA